MRAPAVLLSLVLLGSFAAVAVAHVDPAPLDLESCSLTGARDVQGVQVVFPPMALEGSDLTGGTRPSRWPRVILAAPIVPRPLPGYPCIQC